MEKDLVLGDGPAQDVAFVVDDWIAMDEEQPRLSAAAPAFMAALQGVNFHVGVVTTDMDLEARRGKLVAHADDGDRILDPTDADPGQRLSGLALVGTDGSGDERGLDAAYSALHHRVDDTSAGILRDGAGLTLVFVADEGDQSTWVNSFNPFLSAYLPTPQVFGLVSEVLGSSSCDAQKGWGYLELVASYPGGVFDVCADS